MFGINIGFINLIRNLNIAKVNIGTITDGTFTWGEAVIVTVCGLLIVFAVLILLVLIIMLFGKIMDNAAYSASLYIKVEEDTPPQQQLPVVTVESEDADEIVAVITAAVNEMYADTGKKPIIRSIKPINKNQRNPWSSAGLFDNTRAF